MAVPLPKAHESLAIEAELSAGPCRFVRERLRLPMGIESSFGWLRHPPTVLVVPRCPDGRFLVLQRYQPVVGRWVLEFPSGVLRDGESPAEGGARVLQQLAGSKGGDWQALGVLRPNPGYTDELMSVGRMDVVDSAARSDHVPLEVGLEDPEGGGPYRLQRLTAQALEETLRAMGGPVDGRCVSAWFLASQHGTF